METLWNSENESIAFTDLEALCGKHPYVSWHTVSEFDLDDVTDYYVFCRNIGPHTVS
jgi:hypothetical protein